MRKPSSYPESRSTLGLRWIASFELLKGLVVILGAFGLLSLVHQDLPTLARELVGRLHLNPLGHIASFFMKEVRMVDADHLRAFALLGLLYATLRFVEAYGLWFAKHWGEWIAVISGAIYLPVEIVELFRGFGWIKLIILIVNVIVVLYVASFLFKSSEKES